MMSRNVQFPWIMRALLVYHTDQFMSGEEKEKKVWSDAQYGCTLYIRSAEYAMELPLHTSRTYG